MNKVDVTDVVEFPYDMDTHTYLITCVCGDTFDYSLVIDFYNKEDRLLWVCPKCRAKLYYDAVVGDKYRIMQVIDD